MKNEKLNSSNYISKRPSLKERNFTSDSVENIIKEVKVQIADEELAWMFENCFPNTLDTTVKYSEIDGKPDTFVITGDITAMWLRDSTAQVWPYLSLINTDPKLKKLIIGVINRQTKSVLIDPYANAFNFSDEEGSEWEADLTDMKPELHERKWEIDSLCYVVRLAYGYWKETSDISPFDDTWLKAMDLIYETFVKQQRKNDLGPYKFQRHTAVSTDTLPLSGYGNPTKPNGMINSSFRPSDDACIYGYLVPSNLFAVQSLRQLSEMFIKIFNNKKRADKFSDLAEEIEKATYKNAVSSYLNYRAIFAYEVDGFGNKLFMDEANVPSLLALPYLGSIDAENPIYKNTRKFLFSEDNPYFFEGKYGEGIGGPHVGLDMIWPMTVIVRALTSNDDSEIIECLKMLKRTHADTGFIHETFHKDNPKNFTRSWFAWANTLFGELILTLYKNKPNLLKIKL